MGEIKIRVGCSLAKNLKNYFLSTDFLLAYTLFQPPLMFSLYQLPTVCTKPRSCTHFRPTACTEPVLSIPHFCLLSSHSIGIRHLGGNLQSLVIQLGLRDKTPDLGNQDRPKEKHGNELTDKTLIHSDQGVLYQAHRFRNLLKENNIEQSMSRRGNCYDNAVMESFFATLKCEFVYINKFKTTDEFKYKLEKYIDFYNNYRIKANGLTPMQEKQIYLVA